MQQSGAEQHDCSMERPIKVLEHVFPSSHFLQRSLPFGDPLDHGAAQLMRAGPVSVFMPFMVHAQTNQWDALMKIIKLKGAELNRKIICLGKGRSKAVGP